eukprot:GHVS01052939.1.p1 GENE.GHVS01052939.1~~GHVS01052939.1.p1  ORF type:complete len:301 (+),score=60.15 GHVS01052939.1:154-1056(+)
MSHLLQSLPPCTGWALPLQLVGAAGRIATPPVRTTSAVSIPSPPFLPSPPSIPPLFPTADKLCLSIRRQCAFDYVHGLGPNEQGTAHKIIEQTTLAATTLPPQQTSFLLDWYYSAKKDAAAMSASAAEDRPLAAAAWQYLLPYEQGGLVTTTRWMEEEANKLITEVVAGEPPEGSKSESVLCPPPNRECSIGIDEHYPTSSTIGIGELYPTPDSSMEITRRTTVGYVCDKVGNSGMIKKQPKEAHKHSGKWKHLNMMNRKRHIYRYAFAIQGVDYHKMRHLKWGEVNFDTYPGEWNDDLK